MILELFLVSLLNLLLLCNVLHFPIGWIILDFVD